MVQGLPGTDCLTTSWRFDLCDEFLELRCPGFLGMCGKSAGIHWKRKVSETGGARRGRSRRVGQSGRTLSSGNRHCRDHHTDAGIADAAAPAHQDAASHLARSHHDHEAAMAVTSSRLGGDRGGDDVAASSSLTVSRWADAGGLTRQPCSAPPSVCPLPTQLPWSALAHPTFIVPPPAERNHLRR